MYVWPLRATIVDSEARGGRLVHLKCLTEGADGWGIKTSEVFDFSEAKSESTFGLSRPSPRQQLHVTHLSSRRNWKQEKRRSRTSFSTHSCRELGSQVVNRSQVYTEISRGKGPKLTRFEIRPTFDFVLVVPRTHFCSASLPRNLGCPHIRILQFGSDIQADVVALLRKAGQVGSEPVKGRVCC